MNSGNRNLIISGVLIAMAVALLVPIYNTPIWWVSLEAPNYPEEAFPDGVRILFHVNGVFNGCQVVDKAEILADEALDCVHEMDTINHYVGMYPIASGGPLELFFSIFLLALVAVMALAFVFVKPLLRSIVMVVGFAAIMVWMGMTWYGADGLKYHNEGYLDGRVMSLGEDVDDEAEEELTAAEAVIARLRASLEGTSEDESEPEAAIEVDGRARSIGKLKNAYDAYWKRRPDAGDEWTGSGSQFVSWHYEVSLGRYFRDSEELKPMVSKMAAAGNMVFWGIAAVMLLLLVTARKPRGLFNWLLVCIPITLPLLFVIEYAAWLWWYGHNMSSMGAFTLKAFMPTVFGQGKVAQFTTNSYPDLGFWLMLLFSALLVAAALLRRQAAGSQTRD